MGDSKTVVTHQRLRIWKGIGENFEAGISHLSQRIPGTPFEQLEGLELVVGDSESSGIYSYTGRGRRLPHSPSSVFVSALIEPEMMEKTFVAGHLLPKPLVHWLSNFPLTPFKHEGHALNNARTTVYVSQMQKDAQLRAYEDFLEAWASAAEVYRDIPGATVSTLVASQQLWESNWFSQRSTDQRKMIGKRGLPTLGHIFACIAMFDSGIYNFEPSDLPHVFALSSGNSSYVAAPITDDLAESSNSRIRHVVGNVGRPGLTFLIPPTEVKIREAQNEHWMHINHAPFDGNLEDCFEPTTIHLGFTEYTLPLHQNFYAHNIIDWPASLVETLVSVHDSGKWVADLDILKAFDRIQRPYRNGDLSLRLDPKCDCQTNQASTIINIQEVSTGKALIAVDNWDELLEAPPDCDIVVRTRGNRLARLACAATCVVSGRNPFVLPNSICQECCHKVFRAASEKNSVTAIIC
jgi:hypothetical protein